MGNICCSSETFDDAVPSVAVITPTSWHIVLYLHGRYQQNGGPVEFQQYLPTYCQLWSPDRNTTAPDETWGKLVGVNIDRRAVVSERWCSSSLAGLTWGRLCTLTGAALCRCLSLTRSCACVKTCSSCETFDMQTVKTRRVWAYCKRRCVCR